MIEEYNKNNDVNEIENTKLGNEARVEDFLGAGQSLARLPERYLAAVQTG